MRGDVNGRAQAGFDVRNFTAHEGIIEAELDQHRFASADGERAAGAEGVHDGGAGQGFGIDAEHGSESAMYLSQPAFEKTTLADVGGEFEGSRVRLGGLVRGSHAS